MEELETELDYSIDDKVRVINPGFKLDYMKVGEVKDIQPHPYNKFDERGALVGKWWGMVYQVGLPRGRDWFVPGDLELVT